MTRADPMIYCSQIILAIGLVSLSYASFRGLILTSVCVLLSFTKTCIHTNFNQWVVCKLFILTTCYPRCHIVFFLLSDRITSSLKQVLRLTNDKQELHTSAMNFRGTITRAKMYGTFRICEHFHKYCANAHELQIIPATRDKSKLNSLLRFTKMFTNPCCII